MSALIEFIKAHLPHLPGQAERDEAYLNESVDIYDLERRMREVDSPGRADTRGLVHGVFFC